MNLNESVRCESENDSHHNCRLNIQYIIHSENYDELNFRISVGRKEKMRFFLAIAKLELMWQE